MHASVGYLFLVVAITTFVLQAEAVQLVQTSYYKPWFILYVAHSSYVVFIGLLYLVKGDALWTEMMQIVGSLNAVEGFSASRGTVYNTIPQTDAIDSMDDRLSDSSEQSDRITHRATAMDGDGILTNSPRGQPSLRSRSSSDKSHALAFIGRILMLTLFFTIGSLSWYMSVSLIPMSDLTAVRLVTQIYNSSCFFTYILSVIFLNEPVHMRKLIGVVASVVGILVICLWNRSGQATSATTGYTLAILSALAVAVYEVSYVKWAVPPHRSIAFSVFVIGCMGVCSMLGGLAIFPLFHYTRVEPFEWPPDIRTWLAIAVISVLGMAFNALFMLAMTFTGPVVAAVGILVSIPATSAVDVLVTGQPLSFSTVLGGGLILVGFSVYT